MSLPSSRRGLHCPGVACVLVFGAAVAGCGPDPRVEAAAAAIDLAGAWTGDDGSALAIATTGPASDVECTLQRAAVAPGEQPWLDRLLDPTLVVPSLVLGAAVDPLLVELAGGENVLVDGDVVLHVRSPVLPTRDGVEVRWHLQATGDPVRLTGAIVVTTRERRPRPGEGDGFVDEATRVEVPVVFSR
jgi:hypothetical protein